MAKKGFKKSEGTNLISVIGDEDTVTGFLLTGIGEKNTKGEPNFLVVDSSKTFSCIAMVDLTNFSLTRRNT